MPTQPVTQFSLNTWDAPTLQPSNSNNPFSTALSKIKPIVQLPEPLSGNANGNAQQHANMFPQNSYVDPYQDENGAEDGGEDFEDGEQNDDECYDGEANEEDDEDKTQNQEGNRHSPSAIIWSNYPP